MIRFFQFLIAIALLAVAGFFILQSAPEQDNEGPKYKFVTAKYQPESEEHRNLYLHYSSLDNIPMPVGTWEGYSGKDYHFILKVNEKGGFILSVNPNANDDSEGALTGVLNITGQAFKAHHVVGSAKKVLPKSGHIVVKQYTETEVHVIHPQTLEVIRFKLIAS
ncbi:hypothetical protein [Photobacterium chitinilyticum]|uniref:Uncharacterized protein n=1 Tax=Photobacterium chitinilyticum TaxID=2485123 RepID=A0A444JSE7_9GAMM|nr:hypothetical protein [Photobacterium chitinilyticum]RWX56042.1 hypothetical protein EDI28_07040 [Photobacterium chitinilyticum]